MLIQLKRLLILNGHLLVLRIHAFGPPPPKDEFSLTSAFHLVHSNKTKSCLYESLWLPQVPIIISFFMLRSLQQKVPTDDVLFKFDVMGPSKCWCCCTHKGESIDHMFATSDLARYLWKWLGLEFDIPTLRNSVRNFLATQWFTKSSNPLVAFLIHIIPLYICWHIWKF